MTKTKRFFIIALCAALSASIFLSGCSEMFDGRKVFDYNKKVESYSLPNIKPIEEAFDKVDDILADQDSFLAANRLVSSFNSAQNLMLDYRYAIDYAIIENYKSPDEWGERYSVAMRGFNNLYSRYCKALYGMYTSKFSSDIFYGWSESDLERVRHMGAEADPAYAAIQNDILEVQTEYNTLTLPDTTNETEYKAFADEAAKILVQLAELENSTLDFFPDYSSYAEYAYAVTWERDYTPSDIDRLSGFVKTHFNGLYDDFAAKDRTVTASLPDATALENVYLKYFEEFGNEMTNAYTYMNKCNLYYKATEATNPKGLRGAFTTQILEYSAPYIYQFCNNTYSDVSTFIHEFGHYTAAYIDSTSSASLDINEVQSLSNEWLFAKYLPEVFGAEQAEKILNAETYSTLVSCIAMGFIMDEFQREIYENIAVYKADTTKVTDLFVQLCTDYGVYDSLIGTDPLRKYWWAQVHHTFNQPMYYISYAISQFPAAMIYQLSQTNRTGALNAYRTFMKEVSLEDSYTTMVFKAGLSNPFQESTIQSLATFFKGLAG